MTPCTFAHAIDTVLQGFSAFNPERQIPIMTTESIPPTVTADPMDSSNPSLSVVVHTVSDCSEDHSQHDHGHHAQAGDCCAATLPVTSAEKMSATTAVNEGMSNASDRLETASADNKNSCDDAALIDALREVIDPELMINIVDLGLVYSINHTDRKAQVEMTLTSPACPAGPQIIAQAKMALEKIDGIDLAEIKLTMSPPWTPARMTDEARDQLGIF